MENSVFALFGMKGSGKSTLAREICREWPRVIALDVMAEYPYEQAWGFEECCALLQEKADENTERYRVSLTGFTPDEGSLLLGILWEFEDTFIVVEEAGLYCPTYTLSPEISQLVLRGRHRRISQLYTSQRPALVNRSVTANCDAVISFRQHEPRDVLYMRGIMGEEAEQLRNLPEYGIHVYTPGGTYDKLPIAVLNRLESQHVNLSEPEPEDEPEEEPEGAPEEEFEDEHREIS